MSQSHQSLCAYSEKSCIIARAKYKMSLRQLSLHGSRSFEMVQFLRCRPGGESIISVSICLFSSNPRKYRILFAVLHCCRGFPLIIYSHEGFFIMNFYNILCAQIIHLHCTTGNAKYIAGSTYGSF